MLQACNCGKTLYENPSVRMPCKLTHMTSMTWQSPELSKQFVTNRRMLLPDDPKQTHTELAVNMHSEAYPLARARSAVIKLIDGLDVQL